METFVRKICRFSPREQWTSVPRKCGARWAIALGVSLFAIGGAGAAEWARTYGISNSGHASAVQPTSDGGFIVAGNASSPSWSTTNAWVFKLDATGNIVWQKRYGDTTPTRANSVQQTSDGGYVVAGEVEVVSGYIAWILKLDSNGSTVWQKTYGNSSGASAVRQTSDGGYIVAGSALFLGAGSDDAWVLKLDAAGDVVWQRILGAAYSDEANTVELDSDGGYIVAGNSYSFGAIPGDRNGWLFKLDSGGNVMWQKYLDGPGADYITSVQPTPDGGYIVGGVARLFGFIWGDAWILKLDASGDVVWQKTYGDGTLGYAANAVRPTADGGYIIAGYGNYFVNPNPVSQLWVMRLDGGGNIIWQRTFGGSGNNAATSAYPTADGGYIVGGQTSPGNAWVLKLDSNGTIPDCAAMGTTSATATDRILTTTNSTAVANTTFEVTTPGSIAALDTAAIAQQQCPSVVPPALQSVVSRKAHGGAGVFDLPLAATPLNPTTEPRLGPAHAIVFTFDKAVIGGNVMLIGAASAGTPTYSGNEMSIPITSAADQHYVTVAVSNATSADGGSASASVRVGFLAGNVTQTRQVLPSDVGVVRSHLLEIAGPSNFLFNVTTSGQILPSDVGVARLNLLHSLPAP
jgi:hypothetical protein